ncbi:MAG: HDOD domain-containing protein [Candidatus Thiodiazotropha sp. (ex Monitilora ramsayi)]|nr:HDOD domain-containing protein [Candidatus Thiodiazotropha sp. (ex Monitilora ramsayi)]
MKDIYLGRQAIYDRDSKLFAYELLFRSADPDTPDIKTVLDGDGATSEVLLNTFMEIGLERIAGDSRIFINLTKNLIACDHPLVQQKDRVVMELLEDIPVDETLVERVSCLAKMGVKLALDDYIFDPAWDPLLPWVSIVKLEIPALNLEQIRSGLPKLRQHKLKLLAEKVETRDVYNALHEMGFDYFQGYYFSRPELIGGKTLEENQMVVLRMLAELNRPDVSISEIENLIKQDAGLSYKTLRYINSAAVGIPRKITSIGQAVIMMGLNRIRAWTNLLVMTGLTNRPQDHYLTALVRAHLCDLLVRTVDPQDDAGFTVGLLSILDLLLNQSLEKILDELSLCDSIRDALLTGDGVAGKALTCVRQVEAGEWHLIDFPGVERDQIYQLYLTASEQAFLEQRSLQEIN